MPTASGGDQARTDGEDWGGLADLDPAECRGGYLDPDQNTVIFE